MGDRGCAGKRQVSDTGSVDGCGSALVTASARVYSREVVRQVW